MAMRLMRGVYQVSDAELLALQRAVALGGVERVERLADGVYAVPSASRPGTYHVVSHPPENDSRLDCSCDAGRRNHPCWHQMAVVLFQLAEQQREREQARRRRTARGAQQAQGQGRPVAA